MDLTVVVAFAVAVLFLSIAPGPDMMFIVANSVTGGRWAGVVAATGASTGLAVHTVAAAFGLGTLLQAVPAVLGGVRIAGAVFLAYLAFTTWKASRKHATAPAVQDVVPQRSLSRTYGLATLTNLANPKVVLFFLAFFPQFLTAGPGSWPVMLQFLALGALFIAIGVSADASVALLAATLSDRLCRRSSFRRWLDRVSAAVFGGLAIRLALDSH